MAGEIEGFIRDAARRRGMNPDVAVKVAKAEGGVDEPARVGKFPTGWSFWPFQLHYGGPGYEQFGTVAGMGNTFTKFTGWRPGDPAAWRDSVRYALNRAKAGGWKPWYGAAAVGVGEWEGIDREHPWNPDAERWDFEGKNLSADLPARTFDPNTPDEKQRQDWTCAVRSTMWLLKSIGVAVTPDEAQDAMSPRYVTPELGLLDATGAGIVQVLRDRWGVDAENHATVTFDQVASWAGRMPVAIGGRNWGGPGRGHWSAVRGYDGTRLLLANPASGTVYGDASLTREQWAWRGPWSAVTVPLAEQQPSLPVPDELADLRRRLNEAVSALGYASGDVAEAADAIAQAATALASTLRSLRPPAA